MRPDFLESKLTPAAKQALDELQLDFRNQVLLRAAESASRVTGDLRELSVQDIMHAVAESPSTAEPRRPTFDSLLRVYAVTGGLTTVGALLFVAYNDYAVHLRLESRTALVVAGTGILLTVASLAMILVRRPRPVMRSLLIRQRSQTHSAAEFLLAWQFLELTLRNKVARNTGESTANQPLSVLIRRLETERVLDSTDVDGLRSLLALRNGIVHGGGYIPPQAVADAIRNSTRLAEKVEAARPAGEAGDV